MLYVLTWIGIGCGDGRCHLRWYHHDVSADTLWRGIGKIAPRQNALVPCRMDKSYAISFQLQYLRAVLGVQ